MKHARTFDFVVQTIPVVKPHRLEPTRGTQLAALLRVLANDTRLRVLDTIARSGETPVSEICLRAQGTAC